MSDRNQSGPSVVEASVFTVEDGSTHRRSDEVAAEEPMEVRVVIAEEGRLERHSIAITMRTPGHDFELAAGFLFTEGIVTDHRSIRTIEYCGTTLPTAQYNVVNVFLSPDTPFDPQKFSRNVYTTSSCGVCGKASLEMLQVACPRPPTGNYQLDRDYFVQLPRQLAEAQEVFSRTGGLHASALFDSSGKLLILREDVGRHNAMDKVVGSFLLEGRLPASDTVMLVSGRASYELIQKALMGGVPTLAAVGAPSSLAIDMAREFNMTLVGFLRNGRFNIYSGADRINLET